MICPHCRTSLKQKERTGNQCSRCRKKYALDPKTNALLLHDIRLGTLIDKLGEGRYYYTSTQLWFAAARKTLEKSGKGTGLGWTAIPILIGTVATLIAFANLEAFWMIAGPIIFLVGVVPIVLRLTGRTHKLVRTKMDLTAFQNLIAGWSRTYRTELPGLVLENRVTPAKPPPNPALALVCPDRSVLICLQVNNAPERLGVALADTVDGLPPNLPVALLHDASVNGYRFAVESVGRYPARRPLDVGLRPRAVMNAKGAVRLREAPPPAEQIEWLRSTGLLTEPELNWLAKGWWSPVAAIRPGALIARIEALVQRARDHDPDPDRRAAAAVGFLTWPTS
jgi:hypothetical protein